jgi:hypothetical protein
MTVMVPIGNLESAHMNSKQPTLPEARAKITSLIAARGGEEEDRYAALLSRCRTRAAHELIYQVFREAADWQQNSGRRVRKFRSRSGSKFMDALERFVGDLLRARAAKNASGRIFHQLGSTTFDDVPVNFDVFMGVTLVFVVDQRCRRRAARLSSYDALASPARSARA